MDTQPALGPNALLTYAVAEMAQSLGHRPGESQQQTSDRRGAAAGQIMAFQPRDVVEAMIAGHCVMFHEMIVDNVQRRMSGDDLATRRAQESGVVAMDRAFGGNLARLERYRTRLAKEARGGAETAGRAIRPKPPTEPPPRAVPGGPVEEDAGSAALAAAPGPGAEPPASATTMREPPATACQALDPSGDDTAPAECAPTGHDEAAEATPPAPPAVPPVTLNRQARRAIGRRARERMISAALSSAMAAAVAGVTPNHTAPAATASAKPAS